MKENLLPTRIRLINKSKEEKEIDFQSIVDGKSLEEDGVIYLFEGSHLSENINNRCKHIRFESTGVLKSVKKVVSPNIDLNDFKNIVHTKVVDVPIDIKINELKLVLAKMNHIVITFYHN